MEGTIKTVLWAGALLVPGMSMFGGGLHYRRITRELRERGSSALATVVKKFRREGSAIGYAVFEFTDLEGRPQSVELSVLPMTWHGLREGGTHEISYIPGRLETAEATPLRVKQSVGGCSLFVASVGGSMVVAGILLLVRLLAA